MIKNNKNKCLLIILALTGITGSCLLQANNNDTTSDLSEDNYSSYILLGASHLDFEVDNTPGLQPITESQVGFGYQFSPHWSGEATYLTSAVSQDNLVIDHYDKLSLSAIYRFKPRIENSWHLRLGLAATQFGENSVIGESKAGFHIGGGYDFHINNNLFVSFYSQVVSNKTFAKPYPESAIQLNYFWAGKPAKNTALQLSDSAPRKTSPADDDRDGVINRLDRCNETPMHYMVDRFGCPQYEIDRESVTLAVNFARDSTEVTSDYIDSLASLARFMHQHPTLKVTIEGHTDDTGSKTYNQILSQLRADVVATKLSKTFGIIPSRIQAKGFGEQLPVATNKTKAGRQQNRRVVAVLSVESKRPLIKNSDQ